MSEVVAITVIGTNLVMDYGTHERAIAAMDAMPERSAGAAPLEDGRTNEQQMIDGDRLPEPPWKHQLSAEGDRARALVHHQLQDRHVELCGFCNTQLDEYARLVEGTDR